MLLCSVTSGNAQDVTFTQHFSQPLYFNPALSGNFNGDYKLGLNYRNQFKHATFNAFQTYSAFIDLRIPVSSDITNEDAFGVGLDFLSDRNDNIGFNNTMISITSAFHKGLGRYNESKLSVGFRLSGGQRGYIPNTLTFHDQFDGEDFTLPSNEILPSNSYSFLNVNGGIHYGYLQEGEYEFYTGIAAHHINKVQSSFYNRDKNNPIDTSFTDYTLLSGYAGGKIAVAEGKFYGLRGVLHNQGPSILLDVVNSYAFGVAEGQIDEINVGLALHAGRWTDTFSLNALSFLAGMQIDQFQIGMSYGVNLKGLSTYQRHQAIFELSLSYIGNYFTSSGSTCPKF